MIKRFETSIRQRKCLPDGWEAFATGACSKRGWILPPQICRPTTRSRERLKADRLSVFVEWLRNPRLGATCVSPCASAGNPAAALRNLEDAWRRVRWLHPGVNVIMREATPTPLDLHLSPIRRWQQTRLGKYVAKAPHEVLPAIGTLPTLGQLLRQ